MSEPECDDSGDEDDGDQLAGGGQPRQQQPGAAMVAKLAFTEDQVDRAALAVANGVQLGVQPPLGAPDTAGKCPPLSRLAAVRWALRCVLSIMIRSRGPDWAARAAKMREGCAMT